MSEIVIVYTRLTVFYIEIIFIEYLYVIRKKNMTFPLLHYGFYRAKSAICKQKMRKQH